MSTTGVDLENILHEIVLVFRYPAAHCSSMLLDGTSGLTYGAASRLLASQADNKLRAVGLWAIARAMRHETDTEMTSDGRVLHESELYIEALRCDPTFAFAYSALGTTLRPNTTAILPDGRSLSATLLYKEALQIQRHAQFYYNLSLLLSNYGATTLVAESTDTPPQVYDKRGLLLQAVRLQPTFSHAINWLGVLSSNHDLTTMPDGRQLSKRELYLEAMRYDTDCLYFSNLALTLGHDECETLPDGRRLNRLQLFCEALKLNPQDSVSYGNLAEGLSDQEQVRVPDGRVLGRDALLVEALICDPGSEQVRSRLPRKLKWTRPAHAFVFGASTQVLFATLLLGLQRLEDINVLPLAHHSMLEDMLEDWTLGDGFEVGDNI